MLMKKAAVLSLILFSLSARVACAEVTGIAFTTDPQSIAVGAVSDKITVQSQTAGTEQKIAETGDLYLSSNSSTGQFSSSNTNWTPVDKVTMSKNSANRTFYYKNSTQGLYTLTAKLVLRDSGSSWVTNQAIAVGTSLSQPTTASSSAPTSTTTSTSLVATSTTTTDDQTTTDLTGISALQSKRYFQYRVDMTSCSSQAQAPKLFDITVEFD